MKRWLLLAFFSSTALAQQYEVLRSAIRSPRSAARNRGTRSAGRGPRFNLSGRMHLIDGDQEILPGVRVYTGGRHTFASQYVSVPTRSGTVVLASDNMDLYENLEKHAAIAQTFDAASNLRAQDRMKEIAGDPKRIVPGHHPAVMTRYPQVAPRVVRID